MNYVEYGKEHRETMVFLHGGGLSWWNYREAAENLSSDYHVVLPVLDGHGESCCDFTSIEENAKRIIDFIDERFGGSVLLMGGLSLGGQILLEILSQKGDICRYALVESARVVPSKCTSTMIEPALAGCHGFIKHRWFSRLQFKALKIKRALFEDYFRSACGISKSNMIAFLKANALYGIKPSIAHCPAKIHVFVGGKENRAMRKSAEIIKDALQESVLHHLPDLHHGEFSINYAGSFAGAVRKIVSGTQSPMNQAGYGA